MRAHKSLYACALIFAALPTAADVVVLDNGDRITGKLEAMEGGQLKFQAQYGGLLELPWDAVRELHTDQPVRLMLEDERRLEGRLQVSDAGELQLIEEAGPEVLPQAQVVAINPPTVGGRTLVEQKLRVNFGASITRGNTETETYGVDGQYTARTDNRRLRLGGEINYSQEDDVRSVNNALAGLQYDRFLNEHWYLTGNLNLSRDEFKDLALRTAAGAGLGYQFWETDRSRLSAEAGLNYVHEDFDAADNEEHPAARWGVDWEYALLSELTLFHHQEGFVQLDEAEAWTVRTRSGARFPLTERVTGSLQINYDYDNEPPADTEKADSGYLLKLGYEW